jgi:hypothetical protein
MLLEPWQETAGVKPLLSRLRGEGIEMLELDEQALDSRMTEVMDLIAGGKVSFVLSFNANTNVDSELFHKVRRKAVDLQVQVISTKEEAEALLLCVGR